MCSRYCQGAAGASGYLRLSAGSGRGSSGVRQGRGCQPGPIPPPQRGLGQLGATGQPWALGRDGPRLGQDMAHKWASGLRPMRGTRVRHSPVMAGQGYGEQDGPRPCKDVSPQVGIRVRGNSISSKQHDLRHFQLKLKQLSALSYTNFWTIDLFHKMCSPCTRFNLHESE